MGAAANVAGYLLQNPSDVGRLAGDTAFMALGVVSMVVGAGMDAGGALLVPTGVGAPVAIPMVAVGTSLITFGAGLAGAAAVRTGLHLAEMRGEARGSSAKSCELNSFDGATEVLMADGSRKAIRDVRVGDGVRATDPATGRTEDHTVTDVIVGEGDKTLVAVTVRTDEGQRVITATDHHPFWDQAAHDWVTAIDLHPGEVLRTPDGGLVPVVGTRVFHRVQRVFNLTVEGLHTYYVEAGTTPVLVHNTNGGCAPPNLSPPGAGRKSAFNQAKRDSGIPTSMSPARVLPNVDRRGNPQPGYIYEFDIPAPGGGTRTVRIREDAEGHSFPDNQSQNRGPHFNTEDGGHYDY
ncbi:polymorphic toxin-type HINT domain-containing protein [Frankia sp. Cr2]|uniref:polymorphic toxin-type HINT domain-containing protein n=1 Tax=Frankia sp. Cr2 TaxID=3073932 RepID=UPI002AD39CE1|nr:polymorphic toxin-type HINT domain-containing protein [Frankia sp. Cr2]